MAHRTPPRLSSSRQQRGLTLLELTVSLLILTLLTTVAIRSTSGLQDQTRYEQTRQRHEMIRTAILGDPHKTVNSSPAISGFVADLGRLPKNLHELLEPEYCENDRTVSDAGLCPGNWISLPLSGIDATTGLRFGWNGPYLHTSVDPSRADAFTDGWGNEARNDADHDYGWKVARDTLPPTTLSIQSEGGRSGIYAGLYPEILENATLSPPDYRVDLSGGVTVSLFAPLAYAPRIEGNCSKSDAAVRNFFTGKENCEVDSGNWYSCSDSAHGTRIECENAGAFWHGNGYGCEDPNHPHRAECDANFKKWRSCSAGDNPDTYSTRETCVGAGGIWFDDWGYAQGFGCSTRDHGQSKKACEENGGTWRFPQRNLCMNVFYRQAADPAITINRIESVPYAISDDGQLATIRFQFPAGASVPMGQNAMGIYEYDGDCDPGNVLYPNDRTVPIALDFHPRSAIPTLNW